MNHGEIRFYRIVHWHEGERSRWVVVSEALADRETWDVIAQFNSRDRARDYVLEVTDRQRQMMQEAG